MREIVIDTETTGLDPLSGHRVVEIGAVELVDHAPTSGLAPSQAKVRVGIRVPVRFEDVRKVVQIAVSSENEEIPWNLFALCDDGTIWRKQQVKSSVRGEGPWDCVGDIPQDEDIYELPGDIEPWPHDLARDRKCSAPQLNSLAPR